jgi:hypothetical protein
VSLEILASTSTWEKCTLLLGDCLLGLVSTLLCAKFYLMVKVFLLNNIAKDCFEFSSLVEKGLPGYFLCTCAWCFFL